LRNTLLCPLERVLTTTDTSVAIQPAVDKAVEERVFSVGPPRDYVNDKESNQVSRTMENENGECPGDL
jgi:hypothetical protein